MNLSLQLKNKDGSDFEASMLGMGNKIKLKRVICACLNYSKSKANKNKASQIRVLRSVTLTKRQQKHVLNIFPKIYPMEVENCEFILEQIKAEF